MPVPQLGMRLQAAAEPVELGEGTAFRLGTCATVFRVVGLGSVQVKRWQPPSWAEAPDVPCHLELRYNTYTNPYLSHLDDDGGGIDETLPLGVPSTVFGRSAELADVVVRHESVSRQHAAIVHAERASYLVDISSASGTYIDSLRVGAGGKPSKLHDGAVITFGNAKATYTYRRITKPSGQQKRKREP